MAKSINITDYKARVKLDTKVAVKGLENLRKAFERLDNQLRRSTNDGMRRLRDTTRVYERERDIGEARRRSDREATTNAKSLIRSADLYLAKNITLFRLRERDRRAAERIERRIRQAAIDGNRLEVASLQRQVSVRNQSLSATMRESAVIANTVHSYARIAAFATSAALAMSTIKAVDLGKKYDKSVISLQAALASSNFVTEEMDAGRMSEKQMQEFIEKNRKFAYGTAQKYGIDSSAFMSDFARLSVSAMGEGRMSPEQVQVLMQGMAKQAVVFGLTTDETKRALNAFSQMANKGKVSAEELKNQLGDVLPGAMKIFSDAMGVSEGELMSMMDRGELLAWDVLPRVAVLLNKNAEAGGALAMAMKEPNKQFDLLQSRLQHFAIGTYNQFKAPLSRLLQLITDTVNAIGTPFAEFFGNVLGFLIDDFTGAIEGIVPTLQEWATEWNKLTKEDKIAKAREWADKIKYFAEALFYAWGALKAFGIIGGIAAAGAGFVLFLKNLQTIAMGLAVLFSPITLAITGLGTAIAALMGSEAIEEFLGMELPQWLKDLIDAPAKLGSAIGKNLATKLPELRESLMTFFKDLSQQFIDWLIADFTRFKEELTGIADFITGGVSTVADETMDYGMGLLDSGMSYVTNIFNVEAKQENHGDIAKDKADANMNSFQGALTNGILGFSGAEIAPTR